MADQSAQQQAAQNNPDIRQREMARLENYIKLGENNRDRYITKNYDGLVEYLDPRNGLLEKLVTKRVISHTEKTDIQGEGTGQRTTNNQNVELVKLLRGMDAEKYYDFLSVLYERQRDWVNALTDDEWLNPLL